MPSITLTPIRPRVRLADAARVIAAVQRETGNELRDVVKDLERTTQGWRRRPRFTVRVGPGGGSVRTDSDVWNMLDVGTRPHDIYPRRGGVLRFRAGYQAKTTPGRLTSGGGGAAGGAWVSAKVVRHPGTFARRWTEVAQRESAARYPARVQRAIDEAVR